MRGSSALLGAVDAELECVRTSDEEDRDHLTGKLTTTKQKESEDGIEFHFEMVKVLTDPVDPNIVSLGLRSSEKIVGGKKGKKRYEKPLTAKQNLVLEAFEKAVEAVGTTRRLSGIPDNVKCIRLEDWSSAYRQKLGKSKNEGVGSFYNIKDHLIEHKYIGSDGFLFWKIVKDQAVT